MKILSVSSLLPLVLFLSTLLQYCKTTTVSITGEKVDISIQNLLSYENDNYTSIKHSRSISYDPLLTFQYDPPNSSTHVAALGLYVRANDPNAIIFYEFDGILPSINSPTITYDTPYIEITSLLTHGALGTVQTNKIS